jgi:hypothetical protein
MSLCYDFDAGKWLDGIEGTKMRLADLRAALPLLKEGHEKFCVDLKHKLGQHHVPRGPGSPQSPFSDAVYAHEKMIREYEALLREEEACAPLRYVSPGMVFRMRMIQDPSKKDTDWVVEGVAGLNTANVTITEVARFSGLNAADEAVNEVAKWRKLES